MGKKYNEALKQFDSKKEYSYQEAVALAKKTNTAKFDATIEVSFNLNVNPKYADQLIRGAMVLPNGTGKSRKVLVVTQGAKEKEAKDAGADFVGGKEILEEIKKGKVEYRVDKDGNINCLLGKSSFSDEALAENYKALYDVILRARPSTVKGAYIKSITVSSTMGPGIRVAAE